MIQKEVTVSFGTGEDSGIKINGIKIDGILDGFKFEAWKADFHKVHLDIRCNTVEIQEKGIIIIDNITINDESIAEQLCQKILEVYGKDIVRD